MKQQLPTSGTIPVSTCRTEQNHPLRPHTPKKTSNHRSQSFSKYLNPRPPKYKSAMLSTCPQNYG